MDRGEARAEAEPGDRFGVVPNGLLERETRGLLLRRSLDVGVLLRLMAFKKSR